MHPVVVPAGVAVQVWVTVWSALSAALPELSPQRATVPTEFAKVKKYPALACLQSTDEPAAAPAAGGAQARQPTAVGPLQ